MYFPNFSIVAIAIAAAAAMVSDAAAADCSSPKKFICHPTTTPPTLDGDLSDWSDHPEPAVTSSLTAAMGGMMYEAGDLTMKCVYDESRIYFAFQVPGAYRFDPNDDHFCASISTMMQVGADATCKYMYVVINACFLLALLYSVYYM